MKTFGKLILGLILFVGLSSFDTNTFVKDWERLGSKKVNYKVEKDVIRVGKNEGSFKKLKLVVTKGNVNMYKMVVHYGNGSKESINVRHNFNKRSTSRVIDLKGNRRIIKKITFIYDTKNSSRKKALIHVFGKH